VIGERGAAWHAWIGGIVVVILLAMFARWVLRSDMQRLSDSIDDARDALVARDDEAFLAFFSPEVTYQGQGDHRTLTRDLARWHEMGISEVHILDRTIELDGESAGIHLVVAVGPELLRIARVDVDLEAENDEGGDWRVRTFSWRRP
jgi:hypothetical protein